MNSNSKTLFSKVPLDLSSNKFLHYAKKVKKKKKKKRERERERERGENRKEKW